MLIETCNSLLSLKYLTSFYYSAYEEKKIELKRNISDIKKINKIQKSATFKI